MTRMIRIEPAPGRQVRDLAAQLVTGPIEVDGRTAYWRRRLAAGDMIVSAEAVARPRRARRSPPFPAPKPAGPSKSSPEAPE